MHEEHVYEEPGEVDADNGVVLLTGPGTVRVRFTPDAAEETSDRLAAGAMKARGQRYFSRTRDE